MKLGMGLEATNIFTFTMNITPAATAATIQCTEQAFAVPAGTLPAGLHLAVGDAVFVSPPVGQATKLGGVIGARVDATDSITLLILTLTAVAMTPIAGVYSFTVIKA
jgi:hypothetical protein